MKGKELMRIVVAFVFGYIVSMMVKNMCGGGLVEGALACSGVDCVTGITLGAPRSDRLWPWEYFEK